MKPISVLIVDDSALMRNLIRKIVESDDRLEVAGVAMNGQFAVRKIESLKPDVIVLDLEMPELDGIGFLEKRLEMDWKTPVVILSAVATKGAEITMKALSLGAADFITKPTGGSAEGNRTTAEELIGMLVGHGGAYRRKMGLSTRSGTPIADRSTAPRTGAAPSSASPASSSDSSASSTTTPPAPARTLSIRDDWPKITPKRGPLTPQIIALGISTGGPNALRQVFAKLSPSLDVPILVVQHMPAGFTAEFANSLNKICPLEVKEAAEGDIVKGGRILIAPGDRHLSVEKRRLATVVHLTDTENVNGHKPSAGVLFDSVAREFGNSAMGIIMTGMGKDGAREIGNIFAEGGITLAQDEESSVVYGMPRVATEHNYITQVVSLDDMADAINEFAGAAD